MHKVLAISLALACNVVAISPIAEARDHNKQQAITAAQGTKCEASTKFVNPKVQPGLVHWYKSIDAAEAASRASRKPILVFQMLGRMDDHFC